MEFYSQLLKDYFIPEVESLIHDETKFRVQYSAIALVTNVEETKLFIIKLIRDYGTEPQVLNILGKP